MGRDKFHKQLMLLFSRLLKMGTIVEESICDSVEALAKVDPELAKKVIIQDDIIDDLELELERDCLMLLATQQPLAKDLRLIGATLKVVTDLERIGDHAVDISKITISLEGQELIKPLIDIPRMAEITMKMVHDALTALINEDIELATEVGKRDDLIDDLDGQIFNELLIMMMSDPKIIKQATSLLLVSRSLERIGDHAVNIAEWVVFIKTGKKPPRKW